MENKEIVDCTRLDIYGLEITYDNSLNYFESEYDGYAMFGEEGRVCDKTYLYEEFHIFEGILFESIKGSDKFHSCKCILLTIIVVALAKKYITAEQADELVDDLSKKILTKANCCDKIEL